MRLLKNEHPFGLVNEMADNLTSDLKGTFSYSDEFLKSIFDLINKRESLREQKQFEDADKIRDEIASRGISLIDHKNKTLWMKKEAIKAEKQN